MAGEGGRREGVEEHRRRGEEEKASRISRGNRRNRLQIFAASEEQDSHSPGLF